VADAAGYHFYSYQDGQALLINQRADGSYRVTPDRLPAARDPSRRPNLPPPPPVK
jgi:hypothetical protein